jgi:hypothetical protein
MFKSPKGVSRYVPIALWSTAKHGGFVTAHLRPIVRAPALHHEGKPKCAKPRFVPTVGRTSDLVVPQHEAVKQYLAAERAIVAAEKAAGEDNPDGKTRPGVYVTLHVQTLADRRKRRECDPCKHNAEESSIQRQTSTLHTSESGSKEVTVSLPYTNVCASPPDVSHAAQLLVAQFDTYADSIIHGPYDPNFRIELAAYQDRQATAKSWEPRSESDMEAGQLTVKRAHSLRKTVSSAVTHVTVCLIAVLILLGGVIALFMFLS